VITVKQPGLPRHYQYRGGTMKPHYVAHDGTITTRRTPDSVYRTPNKRLAQTVSVAVRFPHGRGNDTVLATANRDFRIERKEQQQ
jgi:hypothetical protein